MAYKLTGEARKQYLRDMGLFTILQREEDRELKLKKNKPIKNEVKKLSYDDTIKNLQKKEEKRKKAREYSKLYRDRTKKNKILKGLRRVNEKTNVVYGETNVDSSFTNFYDIINDNSVIAMNSNITYQIKKSVTILKKFNIIGCNLIVSYITGDDVDGAFNPLWLDLPYYDDYDKEIFDNLPKTYDDYEPYIVHTRRFNISHLNLKKLTIDDIIGECSKIFQSVNVLYCITGFDILPASQGNLNFSDYTNQLRAYSPNSDQQFHRMTQCSTTVSRLCIYETYYYLYVDNKSLIKKNIENIKNKLSNESVIIQTSVKKGELSNFLIEKSKELNQTMYVQFYKPIGLILGFSVKNQIIEKITDIDVFYCQKVFLYHNKHVAPLKNKNTIEQNEKLIESKEKSFILKPQSIEKFKSFKQVIGYDFETFCDSTYSAVPFCLCLSNNLTFYGSNIVNEFCDYIEKISTKINLTKSHPKKSVDNIMIYGFNNSRFDNIFIFNELHNRNPSCKYIIMDSSIKMIQYHNVFIYDLSLYYAGSLKDVSSSFKLNIQKGVFPYKFPKSDNLNYIGSVPELKFWNSENDRDEYIKLNGNSFNLKEYCVKYCLMDSTLVEKIGLLHLEQSKGFINDKMYDVQSCPTGAGVALKIFSQTFLKDTLYQSPEKIQKIERLAYKGGRTEVFKKYFKSNEKNKYLYYYDINSSYPFAMTFDMPDNYKKTVRFPKEIKFEGQYIDNLIDTNLYYAKTIYVGNNKNFIPNLLVRSDENDIIATQNSEWSYHWGIELREAISNGCDVYSSQMIEYSIKPIFKDFAEYMYNERLKVKKTNPAKANFFKLVMNSLYGKLGQSVKTHNLLCSSSVEIDIIASNPSFKIKDYQLIDEKVLLKYSSVDDDASSIGSLVRFASYITAIARTNLSKIMRDCGHENIYYCDTDSIFTTKKPSDIFIDQSKLGFWKQETKKIILDDKSEKEILCNITDAIFLAPKSYFYKCDVDNLKVSEDATCLKAKGQPNNKLETQYFYDVMEEKKVEIENEAMFFRSLDGVKIKPQTRLLQSVYNKRIWNDNESSPFKTFNDWHDKKYKK